jgi:hypothetical protein
MKGVPNVFVPKTPLIDNRFFDPLNNHSSYTVTLVMPLHL